jgi:orotidine-5'-phosphate decarboxylase
MEPFGDRLDARARARRSVLCVGLDPRPERLPAEVWQGVREAPSGTARAVERWCEGVLDATAEHVVAVKPQLAFFERLGAHGIASLERVCARARELGLLVVLDGKRGDIGSTAEAYAEAYLAPRGGAPPLADALTVNPYLGRDSLQPFLDACAAQGGGLFVLVRTSNPGGADLQELELAGGGPLWERVAALVDAAGAGDRGGGPSSIGAVVGATVPGAVARARELMPRAPLLLPGVGAQGASLGDLAPAFAPGPWGGLVPVSRAIAEAQRTSGRSWQGAVADAAATLGDEAWRLAGWA